MPPIRAQCQALDPFRAPNRSIGPFIRHFRMQIRVSYNSFFNLRLSLRGKRIRYDWEVLRACRAKLTQFRRMVPLGIAATQRQRADPLRINRLPPDRYLRPLRIIPAVRGGHLWEKARG